MKDARHVRRVALAVLCLMLVGCAQVEVSRATTSEARSAAGPVWPDRDLAFLGAEIDPPLIGAIAFPDGAANFRLLVAVENRGRLAERDVLVEAWLKAPPDQGGKVVLSGTSIAPYLAPGQVQVIELPASGVVPILPSYILVVSVRPSLQEIYLDNNTSEYEIDVLPPGLPLG